MDTLAQMLEDYRNGERGLPSYEELVAIVSAQGVPEDIRFNCDFKAERAFFYCGGGQNPITYIPGGMRLDLSDWRCFSPGTKSTAETLLATLIDNVDTTGSWYIYFKDQVQCPFDGWEKAFDIDKWLVDANAAISDKEPSC